MSVETAFREEWGSAVAILIRAFGDFDLADHGQSGGRALRRLVV